MNAKNHGFTLIELLVVVTIIIVLLALLVPALNKAMYQAKLAICGTRQATSADQLTMYAFDHKKYYPQRVAPYATAVTPGTYMNMIQSIDPGTIRYDDRPRLKGYIQINKMYLDPMSGDGSISLEDPDTDLDTNVFANYLLWYDWYYPLVTNPRSNRSERIGTPFSWHEANDTSYFVKSTLLISDQNKVVNGTGADDRTNSSHPDSADDFALTAFQNQTAVPQVETAVSGAFGFKFTFSSWAGRLRGSRGRFDRGGTLDVNYCFQDGSVSRYTDVEFNDDRFNHVGDLSRKTSTEPPHYELIPRE